MDILIVIGIVVGSLAIVALALIINILLKVRSFIDDFTDLPELTPAEVKQMNMINQEEDE